MRKKRQVEALGVMLGETQEPMQGYLGEERREAKSDAVAIAGTGTVTLKKVFIKFATAIVYGGKTEISLKLPQVTFDPVSGRVAFSDPVLHGTIFVWPSNIQFLRFDEWSI